MKLYKLILIKTGILFLILIISNSCKNIEVKKDINTKNNVIATIDSINIEYSDVDTRVMQELYDQLNKIYRIRKIALKETINDKIIELEANKQGLSIEEYKDKCITELQRKINFEEFCEKHFTDNPLISLERGLSYYDIKTKKGKELARISYNNYIETILLDSLKFFHKIDILLEPPLPPEIDFRKFNMIARGNKNSGVSVVVIADLECEKCKEYNLIYEKLYEIYQDKVMFGFINYASYPNLSILATISASKQGMFWEMKDSLMNLKELPDTSDIYRIANNIGLNLDKFLEDFNDENLKTKLEQDFDIIRRYGIYAVPTVLVNGKPIYDPSSMEIIINLIDKELAEKKH